VRRCDHRRRNGTLESVEATNGAGARGTLDFESRARRGRGYQNSICNPRRPSAAMSSTFSFMVHTHELWGSTGALPAAEALSTYISNILDRPSALKFRRVKSTAAAFERLIARCPAALAVFKRCGFTLVDFPDAQYWVMHTVDESHLRSVLDELQAGIRTAKQLQAAKRAESSAAARAEREDDFSRGEWHGNGSSGSAAIPAGFSEPNLLRGLPKQRAADVQRRQLQARSAVLRAQAAFKANQPCGPIAAAAASACVLVTTVVAAEAWRGRALMLSAVLQRAGLPPPPLSQLRHASGICLTLAIGAVLIAILFAGSLPTDLRASERDTIPEQAAPETAVAWSVSLLRATVAAVRHVCSKLVRAPLWFTLGPLLLWLVLMLVLAAAEEEAACPNGSHGASHARTDWASANARLALGLPACGARIESAHAAFRQVALRAHPDKVSGGVVWRAARDVLNGDSGLLNAARRVWLNEPNAAFYAARAAYEHLKAMHAHPLKHELR